MDDPSSKTPGVGRSRLRDGAPLNVERSWEFCWPRRFGHRRRRAAATAVNHRPTRRSGPSPTPAHRRGIADAMGLGAKTDLLDEARVSAFVFHRHGGTTAQSLGSGRQRPGAIYVDWPGRRFCNESNSSVGCKAIYATRRPFWKVSTTAIVRRYGGRREPVQGVCLPLEALSPVVAVQTRRAPSAISLVQNRCRPMLAGCPAVSTISPPGPNPDFGRAIGVTDCLGDPGIGPRVHRPLKRVP